MFFPLFLFVIVILSIVSVSAFTMMDQHQNTANLMTSTATFYAAESSIEESKYQFKINKESEEYKGNTLIRSFNLEKSDPSQASGQQTSRDYDITIVDRSFSEAPEKFSSSDNPSHFDEFRFIDVSMNNTFTELEFYYQKIDDVAFNGGVLIDIISFPRVYFESDTSPQINFGTMRDLSVQGGDFNRNVKRMMYDTRTLRTMNEFGGIDISHTAISDEYRNLIRIRNLTSTTDNYIVRFQTLGRERINYDLRAIYSGSVVPVELTNQVLEIDSQTATLNMFQRIKAQERSFAPLQPGLDFVLFSDKTISK